MRVRVRVRDRVRVRVCFAFDIFYLRTLALYNLGPEFGGVPNSIILCVVIFKFNLIKSRVRVRIKS